MEVFKKMPGRHWSLVQTRPRNEKWALAQLTGRGLIGYLPLLTKMEIHHRSKREVQIPMFPGYLFFCPTLEEETVIRQNKVVWALRILQETEEELLIHDLNLVRQCELRSDNRQLVVNPGLREGGTARIKSGPFAGMEVVISKRTDEISVVVNLEFFQRNLTLHLLANELESTL